MSFFTYTESVWHHLLTKAASTEKGQSVHVAFKDHILDQGRDRVNIYLCSTEFGASKRRSNTGKIKKHKFSRV